MPSYTPPVSSQPAVGSRAEGIAVTNHFTDPRFTSASHAAASAGTYSEQPTVVADGYQQLAATKSCIEVTGTPSGVGSYIGVSTYNAGPIADPNSRIEFGKVLAGRCAGKVVSVAGGGTWHAALAIVYYQSGYVKVGETVVWTSPTESGADSTALATALGGANGWFTAEGFDNQIPTPTSASEYGTAWADLELRVYLDSGTPGAIKLRMTEVVGVYDPDGDVPYYVGGDLNQASAAVGGIGYSSVYSAKWTGTADASTSVAVFDPSTVYPSQEWGFNDYAAPLDEVPTGLAIKFMQELGCTISREVGITLSGPTNAPIPTWQLNWLVSIAQAGIKLLLGVGPPTSLQDTANYSWPTQAANQATMGTLVVNAIQQLLNAGVSLDMIYGVQPTNEPNNPNMGGSAGSLDPASYVAYSNAIYSALHAQYPSVKLHGGVLSAGGTAGTNHDYGYWLQQMYAANAQYDVLDVHPYPAQANNGNAYSATSGPPASGWTVNFGLNDGWDAAWKKIKDTMASNNDSRSIFVSEIGVVVGNNEHNQAIAYSLLLGRLRRDPKVAGVTPNGFVQGPAASGNDWTPIDPTTYRRRPAARAMGRMRGMSVYASAEDVDASFRAWRLLRTTGFLTLAGGAAAITNSRYDFNYPGLLAPGAQDSEGAFYLNPADFPLKGRNLWVRLRAAVTTNDVAPAVTFTFTLYRVTGWSGASGAYPQVVVGSAVTWAQIASPNHDYSTVGHSMPVAITAAGWYVVTLTTSGATAAGSHLLHGVDVLHKLS